MAQQNQKSESKIMMQIVIGAAMVMTAIMCIFIGIQQNGKTMHIKMHCEKVTAMIANASTIEEHKHTRTTSSGSGRKHKHTTTEYTYTQSYDVVYKYNDKDYTIRMENQSVPSGGYMDGDTKEIYIEKNNPSKVYATSESTGGIAQIITGVIIAIFGLFIILISIKKKNKAKATV